ncbi:50S ribosomal protein L11 methyltransferase [Cyclobacterium plantarum]|uniref:50S ribosomal protein L11 methyltransferase n=1 Tax=Cyclobacterium plantarum TaxID=2716263 RepID=A0ABX0H9F6_9BACT|nr:50S ribosomal protein L11 methyltransferase [Cyclobacterium plantarum]NHE57047.1 50S ribosomal protein L11 methyltransferase [Cyclobacterium plantarum]
MEYLEFKITCKEAYREILMAEMAGIGFDSFLETEEGFDAYILPGDLDKNEWKELLARYTGPASIQIREGILPKVNWNEAWEKHYDPITVMDKVYVRATFHPSKEAAFAHEIIINPKMSFGTGHHATTYLMLTWQLSLDHQNKKVMDAGSGTGILAIMAKKLGAETVTAFDIDDWSVANGNENFEINGLQNITMQKGNVRTVNKERYYDLVLANINKNVLLDEMATYAQVLDKEGYLVLSGFYESDIADIRKEAEKCGLLYKDKKSNNQWAALLFGKTH